VVADDQPLIRYAARHLLELDPELEVVAEAGDGEQAVLSTQRLTPDVLLLNLGLPRLSGFEVARTVRATVPATRIIILTGLGPEYAAELLEMGVHGYLSKNRAAHDLARIVRSVHAGEVCLDPEVARLLVRGSGASRLDSPTPRELDVVRLLAEGLRDRDIASRLCVSTWAVRYHLREIFSKLHASSRTDALMRALQQGWLPADAGSALRPAPGRVGVESEARGLSHAHRRSRSGRASYRNL
jgi:two-component system response regulator DesR